MPTCPPTHRPLGGPPPPRNNFRRRGYGTEWDKAAKEHLAHNPECRYQAENCSGRATLVDHFWPHRGDQTIFWARRYWMSSCASCHSGFKQRLDRDKRKLAELGAKLGMLPDPRPAPPANRNRLKG